MSAKLRKAKREATEKAFAEVKRLLVEAGQPQRISGGGFDALLLAVQKLAAMFEEHDHQQIEGDSFTGGPAVGP